jgi:hypothetical protein
MADKNQDFEMWQGATRTLAITITGTALADAAALAWAMADAGGAVVLAKTLAGGGIARDPAQPAVATVLLYPSDTRALPAGDYAHELRLTDAAGQEDVVTTGTITVHSSLTK